MITARAYAATDKILSSTSHLQNENSRILVMQGKLEEQFYNKLYTLLESHTLAVYGLQAERHLLDIKKK